MCFAMSELKNFCVEESMDTKEVDSFSNSPSGSDDDEEADEGKITEIQKELSANPYIYDRHVQLISLYRKLGDLEKLRSGREKMSALFPLTPELWLDWLTDEKALAVTPEQKEKLISLFERALKDYSSVSVWLEYVQFAIGNVGETWTQSGLNSVRETFERAITAVGIHVTQGCLIWEAYREFESIYLLYLKSKNASEEEIKEQEVRIYNIYKRQLSVPLTDMDKTYKEFKEQFGGSHLDTDSINYSYNKALRKLNNLHLFEETLIGSEVPHYEEYKTYIQYEKEEGAPARVQNVYERALIENCLKEELWLDYTKYLDHILKIPDMSLAVYERAVRNCPWCVQLWVNYGRSLERCQEEHKKLVETFESALGMGFTKAEDFKELWLAYLDYVRRKIDREGKSSESVCDFQEITDVFDRAATQMKHYFWGSESEYIILKYWIFFKAKYEKNVESARQLWKELIQHDHREEARVWVDYATFERLYGNASHYRKALLQALSCASDWQETFVDMLITFEREEGTLETLEKSLAKCDSQMQLINEKRKKKIDEAVTLHEMKQEEKFSKRHSKQHLQAKCLKLESNQTDSVQMDAEGFKIPPLPGRIHQPCEDEENAELDKNKRCLSDENPPVAKRRKVETKDSHGATVKHDPSKDDRTVFLSNLSYQLGEEKIQEHFSEVGDIEEIRLVKDYKGRSKGFCYVVYKSREEAKKALGKDREMLDGRPVLVSPCKDKKNNPSSETKFKFTTGLEKNKLFIKGLPFSTTKEELENMFKEYGSIKDVRIVTYRNGHSKGLAYIEYEDEAAAANAVIKMDGIQIMDHVISVAISNPPPRRPKKEFSRITVSNSLGGGSSIKGPRGRGRTQISLLPRVLLKPPTDKKKSVPNTNVLNGKKCTSVNSSAEIQNSNTSDFSSMLKE